MDIKASNSEHNWASIYDYYEIELRDLYNGIARPQNLSHFEMIRSRAKKYLNSDKIFCEIGFGSGVTLRLISSFFRTIHGLDISQKNVELTTQELLSEGITNAELNYSNILVYEEKYAKSFDVISFIHGLEHFSSSDYPILFDNIKRYLKKDGIFTGALPYKLPFNFRMCPHCNKTFELDGHLSSHDLESLNMLFINNGFRVIYLGNFNLRFTLRHTKDPFKLLYKLIKYGILKYDSLNQLEFIVAR
jgi:SAM-dependent methyltransferase